MAEEEDDDVQDVNERLERDGLVFSSVPLATQDSDAWDDSELLEAWECAVKSCAVRPRHSFTSGPPGLKRAAPAIRRLHFRHNLRLGTARAK